MFSLSKRIKKLPPYLFAKIDREKQEFRRKGRELIDLSIGDPDLLAPEEAVAALCKSSKIKENQKYALDAGRESLRKAIQAWVRKRFKVSVNPGKEILPLSGSKEGLVHFPLSFVNPSDYVIIPNPGYPGYRGAAVLSGARVYEIALLEKNDFLPDLKKIPLSVRNRSKVIYLNYPNNPTTALAPKSFLEGLVKFASKYGIIIVYDNAYSEVYFDEKPYSILQVKGAKEVSIEFHSLSKTFCMTGFRIGFALGRSELINGLLKVKANIDSGIFGAVQACAETALEKCGYFPERLRKIIRGRRDLFVKILYQSGFEKLFFDSTFYVWAGLPKMYKPSIQFSRHLLKEKGIAVAPGIGFGRYGEGYIRFALTVNENILRKVGRILAMGQER